MKYKGQIIALTNGYTVVPYRQSGSGYMCIVVAGDGDFGSDICGRTWFLYNEVLLDGRVIELEKEKA